MVETFFLTCCPCFDLMPYKVAVESLVGKVQGCSHAGDAAADDQADCIDRYGLFGQWLNMAGLGHGHPDKVHGFIGCRVRFTGMYP